MRSAKIVSNQDYITKAQKSFVHTASYKVPHQQFKKHSKKPYIYLSGQFGLYL